MGQSGILAAMLAMSGGMPQAEATVPAPAPEAATEAASAPAAKARPRSKFDVKPDPAVVDAFLRSRSRTLTLADCKGKVPSDCSVTAFVPEPDDTECLYTALVTDRIIAPEGEPAYVHLTRLVAVVGHRPRGKPQERALDDVAVTAAVMFAKPGLHSVCFRSSGKADGFIYGLLRAPDVDENGVPIEPGARAQPLEDGTVPKGTIMIDGLLLGMAVRPAGQEDPSEAGPVFKGPGADRVPYTRNAFREFAESVGCTITGCPDKLAVSVTVRALGPPLPILQGNRLTDYRTNATIMVPRGQLDTLAVKYPDGRVQKVTACGKRDETRVSLSFLCTGAR